MKRWSQKHPLRLVTEISVTPLLDLVLVLLFVFMVAMPMLKNDKALALPTSIAGQGQGIPKETVALSVTKDEQIALDGKPVVSKDLPAQLKALATSKPEIGVIVKMDRNLPIQRLVEIMDVLKTAGIRHTAVAASQGGKI